MQISVTEFSRTWTRAVFGDDATFSSRFDLEGFELAIRDLDGGADLRPVTEESLEKLGDCLIHLPGALIDFLKEELPANERFLQVGYQIAWLFDASRGRSTDNPPLREARREAVAELLELLAVPMERLLDRMSHKLEMRESRQLARLGVPLDIEFAASQLDPSVTAVMEEAASRVVGRLRSSLSQPVFCALKETLAVSGTRTTSSAADAHCVSPAAMTRARHKLRAFVRAEVGESTPDHLGPFVSALCEAISATD